MVDGNKRGPIERVNWFKKVIVDNGGHEGHEWRQALALSLINNDAKDSEDHICFQIVTNNDTCKIIFFYCQI